MTVSEVYHNRAQALKTQLLNFPWDDSIKYSQWLAQTYFFVAHSTRLLSLAAARCTQEQQELHHRFIKHTTEESRHEFLLLKDLKNMGFSINHFDELPATSSFYQTQYYQIEHINPICFFGYILVLEGLAVEAGKQIHQELLKSHNQNCCHFIRVHASEDPDHLEKAFQEISKIDNESEIYILNNLLLSFKNYSLILKAIEESTQEDLALEY